MKKIANKLGKLNFKTIYFNFHYFPFKTAIKLPVFLSANSKIINLQGTVEILGLIKPGMIELGYGNTGNFDKKKSRFIWDMSGKVIFEKNAFIGQGCKIRVLKDGEIYFGENCITTAESSFISNNKITIGKNVLLSWEILILDSDFHKIYGNNNELLNPSTEIRIGHHVWVGCRCTILKGSIIPDNSVIAAGTIVSKKLKEANCIYGGNPVTKLKEIIRWEF